MSDQRRFLRYRFVRYAFIYVRASSFKCYISRVMWKPILMTLLLSSGVLAQTTPQADPWKPLMFFVGTWEGTGTGKPGNSTIEREYKFTLANKFLQATHRSTYAPQDKNPKGEVHDDLGYFYYNRSRNQFLFRQFHVEGFVIHYVLANISADEETFVFESELVENGPTGWRARETYKILGENEFMETFELAGAGKEFEVYSSNHFKRKKR